MQSKEFELEYGGVLIDSSRIVRSWLDSFLPAAGWVYGIGTLELLGVGTGVVVRMG